MPASFRGTFSQTRAIIDATEVESSAPSDPRKWVFMYSQYKHRFTHKILIACAPRSEITFGSKSFGGWVTDCELNVKSGSSIYRVSNG